MERCHRRLHFSKLPPLPGTRPPVLGSYESSLGKSAHAPSHITLVLEYFKQFYPAIHTYWHLLSRPKQWSCGGPVGLSSWTYGVSGRAPRRTCMCF